MSLRSTVRRLTARSPRLHARLTRLYLGWLGERDRWRYLRCRLQGRPYFGRHLWAFAPTASRAALMGATIAAEIRRGAGRPFRVLEVGSWVGGSALVWADAIRTANEGRGLVVCVDSWVPYTAPGSGQDPTPIERVMDRALRRDRILHLFLHNVKASGNAAVVVPCRGPSRRLLPLFGPAAFGFAYVDASHYYSDVLADLRETAPLVRNDGIIAGDDLEAQLPEIDAGEIRLCRECDVAVDPRSGRQYHPGVTLAVGEFFGQHVSNRDGFWAMRKTGAGWTPVDLPAAGSPAEERS